MEEYVLEIGLISFHTTDFNIGSYKSSVYFLREGRDHKCRSGILSMLTRHGTYRTWRSAQVFGLVLNRFAEKLVQPGPECTGYLCGSL